MRNLLIIFIGLLLNIIFGSIAFAHPGRTDSYGCHTCRTNCPNWGLDSGEYHCHNAKALPQPKEPIHSRFGEGGNGYTVPAPEYKNSTKDITPITSKNAPPQKNEIKTEDVIVGGSILGGLGWLLKKLISVLK